MRKIFLFFVLALIVVAHLDQKKAPTCQPLYRRLFFNAQNPSLGDNLIDMFIMFNTNDTCPKSYVTIEVGNKIYKKQCSQEKVQIKFPNGTYEFLQYIHKCPIVIVINQTIQSFNYQVYGLRNIIQNQNELNQEPVIDFVQNFKSDKVEIDLPTKKHPLKSVVLADWAPIVTRPYLPIYDTLKYMLSKRNEQRNKDEKLNQFRIVALIVNGDIAYDLQTDNCNKYHWWMSEMDVITPYWPIIPHPGNHQSRKQISMFLFQKTFPIYRVSTRDGNFSRVQTYRFSNRINFVFYDPFLQMYDITTPDKYNQLRQQLFSKIEYIKRTYPNQYLVVISHYPIICSQTDDPHCGDLFRTSKELIDFMSQEVNGKSPVDFYIGAHMHQYQRVYPYHNGKFVIGQKDTYSRGQMVSVVEGVAGCDYGIIDHPYETKNFSIFNTYNKTGFGILNITGQIIQNEQSQKQKQISNLRMNKQEQQQATTDVSLEYMLSYQHVISNNLYTIVDGFKILKTYQNEQQQSQISKSKKNRLSRKVKVKKMQQQ